MGVFLMCFCELGVCILKKEWNFNLEGDNFGNVWYCIFINVFYWGI